MSRRMLGASEGTAAEIELSVRKGSIAVPRLRRAYVGARISAVCNRFRIDNVANNLIGRIVFVIEQFFRNAFELPIKLR